MGVLSMAWMYLSPVVYGISFVPEQWKTLYLLNPMSPLILAYRDILYYKAIPDWGMLLQAFLISLAIAVLGFWVFACLQRRFAEEL